MACTWMSSGRPLTSCSHAPPDAGRRKSPPRAPAVQCAAPTYTYEGADGCVMVCSSRVLLCHNPHGSARRPFDLCRALWQHRPQPNPDGDRRRARKDDTTMATVLTEQGEFDVATAGAEGEVCVPLPRGRESEFVRDEQVNVAALWRYLSQPVVHSDRGSVWVLAASGRDRAAALRSLEAPDFTLPDPSGRLHSLSDYRGKKVFLVTWASW